MDRESSEQQEIQRLIRLSEAARSRLGSEVAILRHRLDVPSRLKDSLRQHPAGWLLGSLASGLAASLVFRRKPSAPKKRRGIPATLFGLTLTAVRPMAKIWLANQLKSWISAQSAIQPDKRLQSRSSATTKSL